MSPSLKQRVVERAKSLGFDAVGVARADEPLEVEFERYTAFVEGGRHGEMEYLGRDPEIRRRVDTDAILLGAKSVICVARRYQRSAEAEASDPPLAKLVARYARGHDYHNHVRKKLRLLAKFVRTLGEGVEARPLCDQEPILERAWAARAGLGFVGKNGLVIVPGQGSFVLLGEVVTTLDLAADVPMAERCGSCTRCLDACPTSAFEAPFVLDPRRCISYLTIEAPMADATPARDAAREHLFGCDDCQSVCPYNRAPVGPPDRTKPFSPLDVFTGRTLDDLVRLDEEGFTALTVGSPLKRAGRAGLARSAVSVALSRLRRPEGVAPEELVEAERAIRAGLEHDDADVVAEAARATK
ncbi:MAG: tRNA epoxyqueuosine(34) reductase QueG [Polyangiaceae bacterium]|nr:tRNA epoxyqueuosine(34) reductase QueG [Polyangiaceae bacterium]